MELFIRNWYVRVGTINVSNLDIDFSVFKSIKKEPNKCTIQIHNLSENTRQSIEGLGRPNVELRAGYGSDPSILFLGQVTEQGSMTTIDGVDVTTIIEAKDKGDEYQRARINQSFAAGTPVRDVLRAVVRSMGIGDGNINDFINNYELTNGTSTFQEGWVASGSASSVLNSLILGAGYRWTVQNGVLEIRERGRPLNSTVVVLRPGSGLVGSPTADPKGIVSARSQILAGIDPGRKIRIESRQFRGDYLVRSMTIKGSTTGNDWFCDLECSPV